MLCVLLWISQKGSPRCHPVSEAGLAIGRAPSRAGLSALYCYEAY
uniref:Uncharacterized protein n=1 Tax=Anguilla anguilla TaxID=7936 RepID=A0A0E9WM59_ANGAN